MDDWSLAQLKACVIKIPQTAGCHCGNSAWLLPANSEKEYAAHELKARMGRRCKETSLAAAIPVRCIFYFFAEEVRMQRITVLQHSLTLSTRLTSPLSKDFYTEHYRTGV